MNLAGTVVGDRYELLALAGTGGMATVYRARDRESSRVVALKLLDVILSGDPTSTQCAPLRLH